MPGSESGPLSINRHAVLVRPSDVFIEWARHTPDEAPEEALAHLRQDGTVYLIPEFESTDGATGFLERHYDEIFRNELYLWCADQSTWPKNQTYAEFERWFHVQIYSLAADLGDGKIKLD